MVSTVVATACSSGAKKLGQPVPLSNFVSAEKSDAPQPAQVKVPSRFSLVSGLVPARSVPCSRSTRNCSGVSVLRHSSSVFCIRMYCSIHPMRRTVALLVLLASASLAAAQPASRSAPPPDLDPWVSRAMQTFEVPGLGLAIVKDDAVVLAKGYGVRKLGEPTPVDARTLFGIASNTKAFTATALGLLIEEGQIEWDASVVRYLPAFAMWDPFVTRELTVRDLLVHRSGLGLGAGDLLWWPASTYDRKEIARRLRYIQPAASFRSAYAYDNVLYLVAGEVIETLSGQSWEDFVSSRILARVGMTGSNVKHSAAGTGVNVASHHARVAGKVRPCLLYTSPSP